MLGLHDLASFVVTSFRYVTLCTVCGSGLVESSGQLTPVLLQARLSPFGVAALFFFSSIPITICVGLFINRRLDRLEREARAAVLEEGLRLDVDRYIGSDMDCEIGCVVFCLVIGLIVGFGTLSEVLPIIVQPLLEVLPIIEWTPAEHPVDAALESIALMVFVGLGAFLWLGIVATFLVVGYHSRALSTALEKARHQKQTLG